jgi:two-component system cell cycle response regulator DivK
MTSSNSQTVLLVEDHDDSRAAERLVLEEAGYVVTEAATGLDGLALALATLPRVVLIDMVLPGIDGSQLARMLRADPSTRTTALLGLSASCDPEDRACALDAGCDAFLSKPFSPLQLVDLVDQLMRVSVGL